MQSTLRQDGFEFGFDCSKCFFCEGNCCTGESGYIWCTPKEINDMAGFLKLSNQDFIDRYIQKVGYKSSLKETKTKESYSCIFFDTDKKACKIYKVRPHQCRTFPFWDYFKEHVQEVVEECPGIII